MTLSLFDSDRCKRALQSLVSEYGYEFVARTLSDMAPNPNLRLVQVDAPPTATRQADKQSADESRFTTNSVKYRIMRWCAAREGAFDRDEVIEAFIRRQPDATRPNIENVRRRFDALVEIGFFREVDTSGRVRSCDITIAGQQALHNLQTIGRSKP